MLSVNKYAHFFLEVIEWIGSFLILIAYFLLVQQYLNQGDIEYLALNAMGSLMLGISLFFKKAYGTMTLQIIFILLSFFGIYKSMSSF